MKSTTLAIVFMALIGMTVCQIESNANISKECIDAVKAFGNNIHDLYNALSNKDYSHIVDIIEASFTDLQTAIDKCQSGSGLQVKISQVCIEDLENLAKDFIQLYTDFKSGDIEAAVKLAATIYDVSKKAQTDCSSSSNLTDKTSCLTAIKDLTIDTIALQKAIQAKDFVKVGLLTVKVLKDGKKVDTECKSAKAEVGDQIDDLKACLEKIEVLLDDLDQIEKDYNASNYVNLIKDMVKAMPDVKSTKEVCSKVVPSSN